MTTEFIVVSPTEVDWALECEHLMDFISQLQKLLDHVWYQRDKQYITMCDLNRTNTRLHDKITQLEGFVDAWRKRNQAMAEDNRRLMNTIVGLQNQYDAKNVHYQIRLSQLRDSQPQ